MIQIPTRYSTSKECIADPRMDHSTKNESWSKSHNLGHMPVNKRRLLSTALWAFGQHKYEDYSKIKFWSEAHWLQEGWSGLWEPEEEPVATTISLAQDSLNWHGPTKSVQTKEWFTRTNWDFGEGKKTTGGAHFTKLQGDSKYCSTSMNPH